MVQNVATLGVGVDTSDVKRAKGDLVAFGKTAGKTEKEVDGLTKSSDKLGKVAGGVTTKGLKAVTIAATAAIGALAGIGQAIGTISEFSSSVSRMEAISGAAGAELQRMRDIALDLGSTTEFSAMQAADGLAFLSMAGFDAAESIAAIPAVLDLATASGMGLGQAADTASNIMSGFGIAATDAAKVADVLAAASSRANTDVAQLGQAMSTVAPISAALDISLADTAAAIGVLSDAGIQGARAGTAMRGVLASLAGPTDAAQQALRAYGLTVDQVNPQTQELSVIMGRLGDAGLTTADAMTIFGREAASGALVLVEGAKRLGEFGNELENVDGAASDMANTMRDNLGGDIKGLQSAVSGLIIALGDAGLTAVLRGVVQVVTLAARSLTALVDGVRGVTTAIRDMLGAQSIVDQAQQAMATAIDNTSIAIGDQVNAANFLRDTLANGNVVSLEVAQAELAKAEARRADIQAMIEQNTLTARQGEAYQNILADIQTARDALRSTPVTDSEQFEAVEQHLVDMLNRQAEFNNQLATGNSLTADQAAHQDQVEANIIALQEQIAGYNQSAEYSVDLSARLSSGIASIDFGNAIAGARSLAETMNVTLHQAMQMMGILGAAAQAAGDGVVYDPRDPRYNAEAAAAGAKLERTRAIMDNMKYNVPSAPTFSTSGGGGGSSARAAGGASAGQTQATQELNNMRREAESVIKGLMSETERYNEELEALNDLHSAGFLTSDQFTQAQKDLREELNQERFGELRQDVDGFTAALFQGKDAIKSFFLTWVQEALKAQTSNAFQNLLGIGQSSTGGGGFLSSLGGIFAGLFDGGGNIPSGQFGIAGENGPEIIRGPANVTSTAQTARMMRGVQSGGDNRGAMDVRVYVDDNGNWQAKVEKISGAVVQKAAPSIQAGAQQQTIAYMGQSTDGWT